MNLWRGLRAVTFGTILLSPMAVLAQTALTTSIVPANCQGANAATSCGICDLATLAQNLLNTGIYIMIVLSAVMFAWAGFQALTSAGNSEKYGNAKRIFSNVLIGLIIILSGWLVIDTLMKTLVNQNGKFGPWNKICQT